MRRLIAAVFIIIMPAFFPCAAFGLEQGEVDTIVGRQLDILGADELDRAAKDFSVTDTIKDIISGELSISPQELASRALAIVFDEAASLMYILKNALAVMLISSALKSMNATFRGKSVGELSFYVCYMALAYSVMSAFSLAAATAADIISELNIALKLMLPALVTIASVAGGYGEAAVTTPLIIGASAIISGLILNIIIPGVTAAAVVEIVNNISDRSLISRLSEFFRSALAWGLKLTVMGYAAVLSIKGLAAPALNGTAAKTAKAVAGAVPVVGDIINGVVDTAGALTGAVRGASAAAVVIFIIIKCAAPALQLAAMIIIFKLTAALAEPFCEERLVKSIASAGELSGILLGAVVSCALMFILSVIGLMGVL